MKHIAFISQFHDFVGGGEHSLFDLMRHLPDRWKPLLVTPEAGPLSAKAAMSGIEVTHLPMPKLGLAALPALWRWSRWLRLARPSLLHANNSRAAVYAGIVGRLHGVPMLFHCRIAERDVRLDGLIARLASRIICNSRAVAVRFADVSKKVSVIYNGIPALDPEPRDKPWGAARVLLFAGRLSSEKQPEVAVRVFAALAEKFPDLHLAMAGGDDPLQPEFSERIRQDARALPCADRIHWLGQCESMGQWYAAADLLIVPSLHEGFGRVIVEAMGCGVPVAAFAVGGIPEVLQDRRQGRLVDAGDEAALAEAVRNLLVDDAAREAMGAAGRVRAREFSAEMHAEKVAGLYALMLENRCVPS